MKIIINVVFTPHILLFWIFFTVNVVGISAYFIYFDRYLKKMFTRETTVC